MCMIVHVCVCLSVCVQMNPRCLTLITFPWFDGLNKNRNNVVAVEQKTSMKKTHRISLLVIKNKEENIKIILFFPVKVEIHSNVIILKNGTCGHFKDILYNTFF